MAHDYFFHRVVEMPANIPVSLDVQTAEVLDTRTAGSSNDTNSIPFKAAGLLRYETDVDTWKYYNGSNFVPLTSDAYSEIEQNGAGNIGIGTASPIAKLQVKGNIYTEDAAGNNNVRLDDDGTIQCIAITAQTFETSNGGIEIANECISINSTATPLTNDAIRFSHGRILSQSNQVLLHSLTTYMIIKGDLLVYEANRHHYFYGQNVYFNNTGTTSDDRLKWDETPITNGLNVINQLQPQVYWKGKQLNVEPTQTERRRESGFIAQEVEQIPELAHTVSQSEDEERSGDTYYLDYTQIMAFQVAAIKELHKIVQEQNERLLALESSKMTV